MAKKVITIPATISRYTASPINAQEKRKVAAYARVSTDHEEQLSSYEAQVEYYTNYISGRDDWEFVSVYSDEGVTGCNTRKRDGFNKMINDALNGKIQLIITKSVSRFARNTVDSLTTIRKLKENGVECYFEKENIWTFDGKGELLLTIMSSIAQEESRSISENCTWGQRHRFANGKVSVPFGRFLGYDRGEDGSLVKNEKEAVIIQFIYKRFLEGLTPYAIAKELTAKGILTPGKKKVWGSSTVKSILTNEKFKGDALLQKVYTVDFLTKKKKKNEGEVPQYYVEGNHEPIISAEVFDMVQAEFERRKNKSGKYSGVDVFASKVLCGDCGGQYGAKVWQSNTQYRRVIYQCNRKFKNTDKCTTPNLQEDEIKELFVKAVNILICEKDEIISNIEAAYELLCGTDDLDIKRANFINEAEIVVGLIENGMKQNACIAQDQEKYQKERDLLVKRYNSIKSQLDAITEQISKRTERAGELQHFMDMLKQQNGVISEFDDKLWISLLDYATVYKDVGIKFTFRDGSEITVK